MIIKDSLMTVSRDYWNMIDITINNDTIMNLPNGIVHELVPRATMQMNDVYNYEFSFDGKVPDKDKMRTCILNLFWGTMDNVVDVSFIDKCADSNLMLLSLFRFIDSYIFPTSEENIHYINGILKEIILRLRGAYKTVFQAYELLYYGNFHTRSRFDGKLMSAYVGAGNLLVDSLELSHLFNKNIDKLPTVLHYPDSVTDVIIQESNYSRPLGGEINSHHLYGLIRKIYSLDPSKFTIDNGVHFRYYMNAFGGDIVRESLNQVDYSIDTFIRLIAMQYDDTKKIITANVDSLFNMYTHWSRTSCKDNKNVIRTHIDELVEKYNNNWDEMLWQPITKKFFKTIL